MISLSKRAHVLCALLAAGAPFWPGVNAAAQDCTSDAECGAGFRCQTDSYESCSGDIMCTPDGDCTETEGECETVTYSWCTNAICTTDADCPSTMGCQAQSTWECTGGGGAGAGGSRAGAGGGEAVDGGMYEEQTCVEVPADSICIPRHQLPCTVASDCGGGFDCVQSTYTECTGGYAGMGGGDADGGVDDGGAYECHEVPSAENHCQLQDLPCAADAECPEGLLCVNRYVWSCEGGGAAGSGTGSGGSAAPAGGAGGGDPGAMDADGGVGDGPTCELVAQERCMPPEYEGGGSGGSSGGGDNGSADGGVSDPGGGTAGMSAGGAGGAGAAGAGGSTPPGDSDGSSDEDDHDHDHGHGHGLFGWLRRGCSAGGPIGGDPVGWIALGLTALVLRRRARRLS